MKLHDLNLPQPVAWPKAAPQFLGGDVEAFAKQTAEEARELRVDPSVRSEPGSTPYARTAAAPSARLILAGKYLQQLGLDVRFSGQRAKAIGLYTANLPREIVHNLPGRTAEQYAYAEIADRIGSLGLLRSNLFAPDDCRYAIFRERVAILGDEVRTLLPRAFMTSLLVRHLRPVEKCIDHQLDDPAVQADHGLYEIMREQGVMPLDYAELTALSLRATNLVKAEVLPPELPKAA